MVVEVEEPKGVVDSLHYLKKISDIIK